MNDPYSHRRRPGYGPLLLALGGGAAVMVVFLTGTGAGVILDRSGWVPGSAGRPPVEVGHSFDTFWETWRLVEDHYVDRDAVQPTRMTQGAIQGMLNSLGDVGHTSYLTADELQRLEASLKGELEGIGARMTIRKHRPTVLQTLPNSPAQASGLKSGDVLLEVDSQVVTNLSLQEIVEKVRGPAGAVVHLRILREGHAKPLDFDITRAKVDVPDVTWKMLPGVPIAHVAIQDFGQQSDKRLKTALEETRKQGARGLILDLRGNPGGLKEQAVAVTSEFLKDGTVFIEQDGHGDQKQIPVRAGGGATDIPLCVLIDEGTASSAEIFAGALQDHGRAKLIGTKTFGTGTVLQPFQLSDGSAVLLAVSEWLTPKGRKIWHEGIPPDIEVPLPEGAVIAMPDSDAEQDAVSLAKSDDKQLLKALETMKEALR